jgi:hypothetical protein
VPSFFRQRFRVHLEGLEPLDVMSTARDSQAIVVPIVDGEPQMPLGMMTKIVHNALIRTETDGVPRSYQKFLDLLLDVDELADADGTGGAGEETDPTRAALSDV